MASPELVQKPPDGLAIDIPEGSLLSESPVTSPLAPSTTPPHNGVPNGATHPLKELEANHTFHPPSRHSRPSTSSSIPYLANGGTFKAPYPPQKHTRPQTPPVFTTRPSEDLSPPKPRRFTNLQPTSPRRNSFPSTRKDAIAELRQLRGTSGPSIRNKLGPLPQHPTRGDTWQNSPFNAPETNSYFTPKSRVSDPRTRSSTTPGVLPTPRSTGVQNIAKTPLVTPRLENLRRESNRGFKEENLPTTLWDYLMLELDNSEIKGVEDYKRERLSNFLQIPEGFEKLIWFGWVVCLDSFLHMFTILPLRVLRSIHILLRTRFPQSPFDRPRKLHSSERADLLKGLLIVLTFFCMRIFDASRVYHSIRGQSSIKLYALFSVLEIADRLCCSIGQDIFDVIFSKNAVESASSTNSKRSWLGNLTLGLSYNVIHTSILFFQVVTLNVAVNSYSNALLSLLMSNQFVEIKATVFRKFEKENLFQMSCADIIERFHLSLLLTLILLRNMVEHLNSLTGSEGTSIWTVWIDLCMPFVMVLGSEVVVDWCKHAFVTKFNHIRPSVYGRFMDILCLDFVKDGKEGYVDQSPVVARRMGLPAIPLACVTLRSLTQTIEIFRQSQFTKSVPTSSSSILLSSTPTPSPILTPLDLTLRRLVSIGNDVAWETWLITNGVWVLFIILGFIGMVLLKLFTGIYLLRFARRRMKGFNDRKEKEEREEEFPVEMDGSKKVRRGGPGGIEIEERVRRLLDRGEDDLLGLGRGGEGKGLLRVERYSMVSKRIW